MKILQTLYTDIADEAQWLLGIVGTVAVVYLRR
jgi:hypothetical protein